MFDICNLEEPFNITRFSTPWCNNALYGTIFKMRLHKVHKSGPYIDNTASILDYFLIRLDTIPCTSIAPFSHLASLGGWTYSLNSPIYPLYLGHIRMSYAMTESCTIPTSPWPLCSRSIWKVMTLSDRKSLWAIEYDRFAFWVRSDDAGTGVTTA